MQHADLRDTKLVADANDGCRRSAVRADNQLLNDVRVGKLQRLEERPPLEGQFSRAQVDARVLAGSYDSQRVRIDEQRRQRQTLDQNSRHLLAPFGAGPSHGDVRIQTLEDGAYVLAATAQANSRIANTSSSTMR